MARPAWRLAAQLRSPSAKRLGRKREQLDNHAEEFQQRRRSGDGHLQRGQQYGHVDPDQCPVQLDELHSHGHRRHERREGSGRQCTGHEAATSTLTTVAAALTTSTLWPTSTTPTTADSGDTQAVEVGVKFTSTTSGYITGVSFYKASTNTGTHTGSLWSSTGTLLATGTFAGETASGWQTLTFANPVAVTAGTTYVASYHTTVGHYSVNRSYFTSAFTSGSLQVPASGGVYLYGTGGFPTTTYQSSNYWVEPVFSTTAPVDTTPPTVTAVTPRWRVDERGH